MNRATRIGTHSTLCLPKAFVTSVRLLCEREVPLTHRLLAICLLEMHRENGSLSPSLRFLRPTSELGQKPRFDHRPITSSLPRLADVRSIRLLVSKVPISEARRSTCKVINGTHWRVAPARCPTPNAATAAPVRKSNPPIQNVACRPVIDCSG
jgi:hypothetical protein